MMSTGKRKSAKPAKRLVALALGLGLAAAALGTAVPAAAQPAAPQARSGFAPGAAGSDAGSQAFFAAIQKAAAKKQAEQPGIQAVTVTYDPSGAPSYAGVIASSTNIWNSSVSNVRLAPGGSGSDFAYYEGNDPLGSYASTDGHGHGYVFIDYLQSTQYNQTRIVAHETGHILGLPDHYTGPCSELMSGGGPGPSCTNAFPDATERSRVNSLWQFGFDKSLGKMHTVR